MTAPAKKTFSNCATSLRHTGHFRIGPAGRKFGGMHPAQTQRCPHGTQTTFARVERQTTQAMSLVPSAKKTGSATTRAQVKLTYGT